MLQILSALNQYSELGDYTTQVDREVPVQSVQDKSESQNYLPVSKNENGLEDYQNQDYE